MGVFLSFFILFCMVFKILELFKPSTIRSTPKYWILSIVILNIISYFIFILFEALFRGNDAVEQSAIYDKVIFFYLIYSFCNYWIHRFKHKVIWKIHELHHAPTFMQVELTFFRHPIETVLNLCFLFLFSQVFQLTLSICLCILFIEGALEVFHHSNTKTPKWLRPIRYLIQVPEMHLIHHQSNLHRYNYSPIAFWDLVFGTHKVPKNWLFNNQLGMKSWGNWKSLVLFINKI